MPVTKAYTDHCASVQDCRGPFRCPSRQVASFVPEAVALPPGCSHRRQQGQRGIQIIRKSRTLCFHDRCILRILHWICIHLILIISDARFLSIGCLLFAAGILRVPSEPRTLLVMVVSP